METNLEIIKRKQELINYLEDDIKSGSISSEHLSSARKIQNICKKQIEMLMNKR